MRKGKDLFVHYDQVTTETERTMPNIFRRIGMVYEERWLENYKEGVGSVVRSDETWKDSVAESVERRSTFEETFDEKDQHEVTAKLDLGTYESLLAGL